MKRGLIALSCLVALALTGCGDDGNGAESSSAPAALTQEQSELLATARFRNFDAGVRGVAVTLPAQGADGGGQVEGWFDFARHTGYATVAQAGAPLGVVLWDGERIAVNETSAEATLPLAAQGWRNAPLDPSASQLNQVLAIVANLGSDRPENPLLLRQSDAFHLRDDEIDGRRVAVLVGPSQASAPASGSGSPSASDTPDDQRIRYWIDDDGLLLRVELKVAGGAEWTVIDLHDDQPITLPDTRIARILAP